MRQLPLATGRPTLSGTEFQYPQHALRFVAACPLSSISQRFNNALNVNLWRRADSADWADEEAEEKRVLNGVEWSWRARCVSLPR